MHRVLNVDKIKNELHSFVVLCETNILNLISQSFDIFYQIQTNCYSAHLIRTVAIWWPGFGN
jgi:hypothetical protein